MTKQLSIPETIKARQAEAAAFEASHNAFVKKETAELKAMQDTFTEKHKAFQQRVGENQLKFAHFQGCIAELEGMLPKKKQPKQPK